LLAGLTWFLLVASRRRRWDARFAAALKEAAWLTTSVTPSLVNPTLSTDAMTIYWNESWPRIQALREELTALEETKPDQTRGEKVDRVSTALTALVEAQTALVTLRGAVTEGPEADVSLEQSQATVQERSQALQDAIDDQAVPSPPPSSTHSGEQT
jgi:hypothetical protein